MRKLYINHTKNDPSSDVYALNTMYLIVKHTFYKEFFEKWYTSEFSLMSQIEIDALITTLDILINYEDEFEKFVNQYENEIESCGSLELYDEKLKLFQMKFDKNLFRDRLKNLYSCLSELYTQMRITEAKYCICELK